MPRFGDVMRERGVCDARGAGFCATATQLPHGEVGVVALCVNGNTLSIYEMGTRSEPGDLLYSVPLRRIGELYICMGQIRQRLRFVYCGETYVFSKFLGVRAALDVIKEESRGAQCAPAGDS